MVVVVCPYCASHTAIQGPARPEQCPHCGRCLTAAPAGAEGDPGDPDVLDAALVADLREAFADVLEMLGAPGPCRLHSAGSSAAAGRLTPSGTLPPGTRLGDFEVIGELGRGGMGVVYRARQVSLGREVAMKVLPAAARHSPRAVQRFRAEAQAAARLHHTNIVPVYAQGEHEGCFYYAMELVEGVSLDTVIHTRPDLLSSVRAAPASAVGRPAAPGRPAAEAPPAGAAAEPAEVQAVPRWTRADYRHLAGLLAEVADALECAHRQGVIHRDVKPHNLLVGADQRLHLTDFGLARLTDEPHLTVSGEIMGTPAYLSPEQVRGELAGIDHRTDIYSLGVTLYELLTGHKPFEGRTREQILTGICHVEPVPPRRLNPGVPVELETICLRALEKEPGRRHPSAAALAEDLRRFADGRPILSRRATWPVKAAKWARRHPARTVALAAAAAVLVLAAGLTWSITAARRAQARQLLWSAYEQLAYFDYREPQRVRADIDRAAALGADPTDLHLVRGLAAIGADEAEAALAHLAAVVAQRPEDLRARYLLAWAQRRARQEPAARATLAEADRRGPPATADAWFFRGLALHFDDPAAAAESYRRANALRASAPGFYPQAILHLARARNQQLYASRRIEDFAAAAADLRQLVDHGYYRAYPYYLLSIAHRLAAEIYRGSVGTRPEVVAEHYAAALDWARAGQRIDPADDRPITAEAECLESQGLLAEARDARTRAIAAAPSAAKRCEGYHYRWRLHYWLGEWKAALADVARHAACDPDSRVYAHVYPALILAELGDLPAALAHARALAEDAPGSAQAVLWSATCLRLLGRGEEAAALLDEWAGGVDYAAELVAPQSPEWVRALYELCRVGGSPEELAGLATAVAAPWRLWGEAWFHAGAARLAAGDRAGALECFRAAYRAFDGEERYTFQARLLVCKMEADPLWPVWAGVSSEQGPNPPPASPGAADGESPGIAREGSP